ncbi:hypothetical protein HMPREF0621_0590 [Pasteurella dagmatis ATCC 43325]|uniref:Uncharacterized protein n=1 Tax=Pasteurella dagmatis ATCC 43325 TaxID=667128 RepID=C9PNL6_9PAST|nr:hypothetical protein HMPREF0621_0590 [Pasteurella dagmatis ATCC 43325]
MLSVNLLALVSKKGDLGDFAQYPLAQVGLYFNHVEQSLEGKI